MKIVFFLQCLGVGGVERQIFLLADHLNRRGHQVLIIALHTVDPNWKWFWSSDSVQVQTLFSKTPGNAISSGWQLIMAALKLRSRFKKENVQLVYGAQGNICRFIAWLGCRGIPDTKLVWSMRGSGSKSRLYNIGWKKSWAFHACRCVSASVPLLISLSKNGCEQYKERGYRCQNNIIIFDGIDVDRFQPDQVAGLEIRNEWGVPKERKMIGMVGRLAPVKGHLIFLKAIALLAKAREDLRFVCVGSGPQEYRDQIFRLSQDLELTDCLIWAGSRQDMSAIYNALDILCAPSYSEGFNNVLGEAMACGVPCVVTDVGDPANIVGETGIIVSPGNPEILAQGLETMLRMLDKIDPHLLRQRIVERFSLESMIENTERALIDVSLQPGVKAIK